MQLTPDQLDVVVVLATIIAFTAGWHLFGGGVK